MAGADLGALVRARRPVVAPGAWDAFSARMIERHGFPAVYLTGYGTTASRLGRPDIGFINLSDMCATIRAITQVVGIPLIADGESGFGNAVTIERAIREYEQAGAAAIHLEDQVVPKSMGGLPHPQVVPAEDHAAKIRLAVRSRTSSRLKIIGRTDCLPALGLDEAIRRGNAYRAAGADIVFVHGISTRHELVEVARRVRAPTLVNYSALSLSDDPAPPSVRQVLAMGYAIVILAIEPMFAAAKALESMLRLVRRGARAEALRESMAPRADIEDLLGAPRCRALEDTYLPRAHDAK